MKKSLIIAVAAGLSASYAQAQTTVGPATWIRNEPPVSSGTQPALAWTNPANWSGGAYPTGEGSIAIFNNDIDSIRRVSLNPSVVTAHDAGTATDEVILGSLTVNNTSNFVNEFTAGDLRVFIDGASNTAGEINLLGNALATLSNKNVVPTTWGAFTALTSDLVMTVDRTSGTNVSGDVNITGTWSGTGGFTKAGAGIATITNGADMSKNFQGPTIVSGGRLRMGTLSGSPNSPFSQTSSVTVNSGAQLDLGVNATTNNSLTFGASSAVPININGAGIAPGTPTGGQFGASGAIRSTITQTLQNNIVVQGDLATITSNATAGNATFTLTGVISGAGSNRLQFGGFGNAPDGGKIVLTSDNTYAGGTAIRRGIVEIGGSADLGSGDVLVDGASRLGADPSIFGLAAGKLSILNGATNAIADSAALNATGDTATALNGAPDGAVGGIVTLGAGVNEQVSGLVLGGVTQTAPGTYGATGSGATNIRDAYFSGTGTVNLAFTRTLHWDRNGEAAGAGGVMPSGNWDGDAVNFNSDVTGGAAGTQTRTTLITDPVDFSAGTDATGTYTVNVSGTQSAASVAVSRGDVTLAGGTINTGSFNVASGATGNVTSTVTGGSSGVITKSGLGSLRLGSANTHAGGTNVNAGTLVVGHVAALGTGAVTVTDSTLQIQAALPTAVSANSLSLVGAGTVDMTDGALIIKTGGNLATVAAAVASGATLDLTWNGTGILSTVAANDPNGITAVGFATGADYVGGGLTDFVGVAYDDDDILIRTTYYGDSDLNGDTNLDDYPLFIYGLEDPEAPQTWYYGDYNYSGEVDIDDFPLFIAGLENDPIQTAALADLIEMSSISADNKSAMLGMLAAVPEPGSLGVLGVAAAGLLARRRRRA